MLSFRTQQWELVLFPLRCRTFGHIFFPLFPSFSFFCFSVTSREEEKYVGSSVDVDVSSLKLPGEGKKTHYVLESFDLEPMWICNMRRLNCWNTRLDLITMSFLVSKANAPSSMYIIQIILKRVPWENVFAWWLVILPEDWGELLCRLNLIIFKSFITHYFSIVSANAIMINKKSTGAELSSCLTPTSKGMYMSIFYIINLTLLSMYILLIAEHNLGGQPYFFNISTIS